MDAMMQFVYEHCIDGIAFDNGDAPAQA